MKSIATIINDVAQWNISAFHSLTRISLIKDRTQESAQLDKVQAVILAQPWPTNGPIFTFIANCWTIAQGLSHSG